MTTFKKLIRNGKVAVIHSPGFGAGWSTWDSNGYGKALIFDHELALAVLGESKETPEEVVERKFPEAYTGGLKNISVAWLSVGTNFFIKEYDGAESIVTGESFVTA